MKKSKKIGIVVVSIALVYIVLQVMPYFKHKKDTPFRIEQGEAPLVIAVPKSSIPKIQFLPLKVLLIWVWIL